jgi:hypothetical protein
MGACTMLPTVERRIARTKGSLHVGGEDHQSLPAEAGRAGDQGEHPPRVSGDWLSRLTGCHVALGQSQESLLPSCESWTDSRVSQVQESGGLC